MNYKELYLRIISSIILVLLCIFFIFNGSFLFNIFIILCFFVTIYEWQKLSKNKVYNYLGYIFLIISFFSAYSIRHIDENSLSNFVFVLIICISTDLGGYFFGKIFKGPKLTKISPKKTYSGVFGGYFLAILLTSLIMISSKSFLINDFILNINNIIIILLISTVSQVGDIIISYFKRLSKIKDTGKLIPGHGGILDRIDGMIFAFPFYYIIILLN